VLDREVIIITRGSIDLAEIGRKNSNLVDFILLSEPLPHHLVTKVTGCTAVHQQGLEQPTRVKLHAGTSKRENITLSKHSLRSGSHFSMLFKREGLLPALCGVVQCCVNAHTEFKRLTSSISGS
jgi:hypothetical protein